MAIFRHCYLTHPEVEIDPARPVTDWALSDRGRARAEAFAGSGRLPDAARVVSSSERKAVETAAILARALGLPVEYREAMHENDRSATGYLPRAEFEATADAFFADPGTQVRGWESAAAAQARIVAEVASVLTEGRGPVLFVGHGAVGTLLWCHLSGNRIDRRHDQPDGGGCLFGFGDFGFRDSGFRDSGAPDRGWRRMEEWGSPGA